jgi:5-methylcytosine-specific restriction endonuclease McrA
MDGFNQVKNLISHIKPSASIAEVIEYLTKFYLSTKDPSRTKFRQSAKAKIDGHDIPVSHHTSSSRNKSESSKTSSLRIRSESINTPPQPVKAVVKLGVGSPITTETVVKARHNSSAKKRYAFKNRRAISASIKRAVWQRDKGQCQHFNPTTGRVCGSNHRLELDHIKRYSHGGDDSAVNLRLLCKAHNLWRG